MGPGQVLQFEAESHTYSLGGKAIPSVTQLMQNYGVIDTTWFGLQAKVRGRHVHTATEYYDDGDLDMDSLDPIVVPYMDAYIKFRKEYPCHILHKELMLFDEDLWYAGTLDRLVMPTGIGNSSKNVLFDIKTGQRPKWVHIQLAAYKNLLKRAGIRVDECFTLHLRGDGTYRFDPVKMINIIEGWKDFEAMARVDRLPFKFNKEAA